MRIVLATRAPTDRERGDPNLIVVDYADRVVHRAFGCAGTPPRHFIVAASLLACWPGTLLRGHLLETLWGDDPDGGPERANIWIGNAIFFSRQRLAPLGIVVENEWHRGWRAIISEAHQVERLAA